MFEGLSTYKIIYADPPWQYADKLAHTGYKLRYKTMDTAEIATMPVSEIAARDCALFLWVTGPMVPDAMTVLEGWGFRFVTVAFVWVKVDEAGTDRSGLGHWTVPNAEYVFLARRGNPRPISKCTEPQIVRARVRRHAEKPTEVRNRIERMMGECSRIELFARYYGPGWHGWGDHAELEPQAVMSF